MSRDRRAIDLLFASGIAAAGASAALFGVIVIVQAIPDSSVPVLGPLASFFGALAAFLLALGEWYNRRSGRV